MLDSRAKNRIIALAMTPEAIISQNPLLNGRATPPVISPEANELLTYQQAAERCKVHESFIRKAVRGRELRAVILSRKVHRITLSELHRWWKAKQMRGFTTPI
jgi:excisionase family DNA binding protein